MAAPFFVAYGIDVGRGLRALALTFHWGPRDFADMTAGEYHAWIELAAEHLAAIEAAQES